MTRSYDLNDPAYVAEQTTADGDHGDNQNARPPRRVNPARVGESASIATTRPRGNCRTGRKGQAIRKRQRKKNSTSDVRTAATNGLPDARRDRPTL